MKMRKYNVSNIERLTYEMLVDIIGAIFKAKAHNAYYSPVTGTGNGRRIAGLCRSRTKQANSNALQRLKKN